MDRVMDNHDTGETPNTNAADMEDTSMYPADDTDAAVDPDTGETNPDTGETLNTNATDMEDTIAYPADSTDTAVDCCNDSPSLSSSNEAHIHTKSWTLHKKANVP